MFQTSPALAAPDDQMHGMSSSPADADMASGMSKMQHDMQTAPMTGDADHDFVSMMLPHHQGAVAMARSELRYGKDPEMRHLARNIIAAQDREITLMNAWLRTHSGSSAATAP